MKTYAVVAPAALRVAFVLAVLLPALMAESGYTQSLNDVHMNARLTSEAEPGGSRDVPQLRMRPLRKDVDLVLIPTTVTDQLNRPVTDLQRKDFTLFDGESQQQIEYFHQEDAPMSIGILLDTTGSMKNKYDLAKEALHDFFNNANRQDDYFVITFSQKPKVLADTTQSVEDIERELDAVIPEGSTPLLDAIYMGLSKLKHARYDRRALLIISDGGDNDSRYSSREIRDIVRESDVQIYAMGIFAPFTIAIEDIQGKKLLSDITGETGGRAAFFSSPKKMPETAADFSRELRSTYVLGYRLSDEQRDGKMHRITVRLTPTARHPLQLYYKKQYIAWH